MAVETNPLVTGVATHGRYFGTFDNMVMKTIDFSDATWNTAATHEVFTVTGVVRAMVIYRVTESLASAGSPTIAFGVEGTTNDYAAAQNHTNLTAGRFVSAAGTVATNIMRWQVVTAAATANTPADNIINGLDIGYVIATAAMTDGTVEAYCFWSPISAGATVVEGAGGAL
jgi:hypothetical protein